MGRLILVLFIFVLFSSAAPAREKDIDVHLKSEYGQDLTHAPFFLRYAFYKATNKDWKDSYFYEREEFLKNYESEEAADRDHQRAIARAEAQEGKEHLQEKKDALRKEKDRLRAELDQEKAQKKADEEEQKQFNQMIKDQQIEINQMQRALAHP